MNVKVGDLFVWEDIKIVLIEIVHFSYKAHIYNQQRVYNYIYDYNQIKAMMDYRSGYTYYRVVKQ